MLLDILFILFIISLMVFLVQVPVFSWGYKVFVSNAAKIDYINTSFYFFITQILVVFSLYTLSKLIPDGFNSNLFLLCSITINVLFLLGLTCVLHKLVLKIKLQNNFILTFMLLIIIIMIEPLFLFLILSMLSTF